MNVSILKVGGKEYPVKWCMRAKIAWEKDTQLLWVDILPKYDDKTKSFIPPKVTADSEQDTKITFYALKEGHRIKEKDFNLTLEDVMDLTDLDGFHEQMGIIIFGNPETEKKSKP